MGAAGIRMAHESARSAPQPQVVDWDSEEELEAAANDEVDLFESEDDWEALANFLFPNCLREPDHLAQIRASEAALQTADCRASVAEACASSANVRLEELARELEALQAAAAESADRETAFTTERARLQAALAVEKQLHQETVQLVEAQRLEDQERTVELRQELQELSAMLSEKEEDFLNIQFEMVALSNRLGDERALVNENANAFQSAAEELADKEELLEKAQKTQEVLHSQMNELSEKLQDKVSWLTEELEGHRSSYRTLEEQSRSTIARLEADREVLSRELERVRAEMGAELSSLRAELQRREVAASEQRTQLELELTASRAARDRIAKELEAVTTKLGLEETDAQQAASAAKDVLEAELHEEAERMVLPRLVLPMLRKLIGINRTEASAIQSTAYSAAERGLILEKILAVCIEKFATSDAQNCDLSSARELIKFLERKANERAMVHEQLKDFKRIEAATIAPAFETAAAIPKVSASICPSAAQPQPGDAAGGGAKASTNGTGSEESAST